MILTSFFIFVYAKSFPSVFHFLFLELVSRDEEAHSLAA